MVDPVDELICIGLTVTLFNGMDSHSERGVAGDCMVEPGHRPSASMFDSY